MKRLLLVTSLLTFISCTKSTLNDGISKSVDNQAVVENYNYIMPVEYVDINPCNGDTMDISGKFVLSGHWLVVGNEIRFKGTQRYQQMKGIGRRSGDVYKLNSLYHHNDVIDYLLDDPSPEGLFSIHSRASIIGPKGSTFVVTYTHKFTLNLFTYETVFYKSEFSSECK